MWPTSNSGKAPGANYGGTYNYDAQTGGNAFWIDGETATSYTAAAGSSAGGSYVVDIKGWDMLPTDMDLAYDGAVTFTLAISVLSGDFFFMYRECRVVPGSVTCSS